MNKISIITIFYCLALLAPRTIFSQDNIAGVYYRVGGGCSLNLLNNQSSLNRYFSCMSESKAVGTWIEKDGIIIICQRFIYPSQINNRLDSLGEIDTLYFARKGEYSIEQFFLDYQFTFSFKKEFEFYNDGKIKLEIKGFDKYPYNGRIKSYYENGKMKEVTEYKKGMKNGKYNKFNDVGILIVSGRWRNNKKRGRWKYFN